MALPVTGPVHTTRGGVRFTLRPPLEFIQRQVGDFRRELEDLDPLWDRFSAVLPDIFQEHFESHGAGEWPALAEATVEQKIAGGFPWLSGFSPEDPLVRTGDLLETLKDPNRGVDRQPQRMSWGPDVGYAGYHQEGDDVPQRQVIPDPFTVEHRRRLEQELVAYINDAMQSAFRRVA